VDTNGGRHVELGKETIVKTEEMLRAKVALSTKIRSVHSNVWIKRSYFERADR
jgi:hypothetical protein